MICSVLNAIFSQLTSWKVLEAFFAVELIAFSGWFEVIFGETMEKKATIGDYVRTGSCLGDPQVRTYQNHKLKTIL